MSTEEKDTMEDVENLMMKVLLAGSLAAALEKMKHRVGTADVDELMGILNCNEFYPTALTHTGKNSNNWANIL